MYLRFFVLATAMLISTISWAAGGVVLSPTGVAPDRYVYYPGTEEIAEGEIRLIACGTGLPAARRDQAATCWLAELGNGDKFFFDIGTGSMANVAALMIPYDFLDKGRCRMSMQSRLFSNSLESTFPSGSSTASRLCQPSTAIRRV